MIEVDAQRVRELLDYDTLTGIFTWRVQRGGWAKAGSIAGKTNRQWYIAICIDYKDMLAHRLAYLYVHGNLPDMYIDHINGIKNDNRISNLRLVTQSENLQNQRKPRSNNTTGFLGVHKRRNHFAASIVINKKMTYLGLFPDAESAYAAYIDAKRLLHSHGGL